MIKFGLIKRQSHINSIPLRFAMQYERKGSKEQIDIIDKLNNLKAPLNEEDINIIIGNNSWTSFKCDVCNQQTDLLLDIKPYYYDEYDSRGIVICKQCLDEANKLIKG